MRMKIRDTVTGMSTASVPKFARTSAAKKGILGTLLFGVGLAGLNLLLTAIQEQAFAAGFEDSECSNNAVLCKLHESGKVSWEDVSEAADAAAEEAGLPPLNKDQRDITITQF